MKQIPNVKAQGGFTLIEIAIVLVIIGLLIGGVLQGQQLIENSRVRAAVNDIQGVPAAAYSYQDRYGRYPGDDGNLTTLQARGGQWAVITAASTAPNGVLDGAIATTFNPTAEVLGFWQHLRASGFIPGDPSTTGAAALPQNPFGGLIGVNSSAIQGMPAGSVKLCMNNVPGSAAIALDTQLDDGAGASGTFRANAAATPNATAMTGAYDQDTLYTVCVRI
ncbi:MAG: prepilin-type cleavage/methylation domain-containing protein [Gammaproteobacteria bacterium]|nr:prepilin-type cleavage/methylation domain-containing protein [Gammaproteobacteria bacterium]MBJ53964.1 prepilin-type cleavage/methylation domain-containing protein [Gammaproteobacteria bacterium]HBN14090.1 prepilin-type cleavage/methylation domain-containing protein [Pseudohongiella sp.]|tara:strand:+ start:267 stop:929 length:663 start_codon:yes stop_codon:yes gene_type:complete